MLLKIAMVRFGKIHKITMTKLSDIYWFLEAEYDAIRDWVELNESQRRKARKQFPGAETPKLYVSFESVF